MTLCIGRRPDKGRPAEVQSLDASFDGVPFILERLCGVSICARIIDTDTALDGSIKLQVSNNAFADNTSNELNPDAFWVDVPNSSVAVTGDGNIMWNVTDANYEAIRIVWTSSAGEGTLEAYFLGKGY